MPGAAVFVTSNPDKLAEARAILRPRGIALRGILRSLPEPQADTLEEVARAKLDAVGPQSGPVLVEDSGLFLESLGGFPGVYSSYAYRTLGLEGLLRALSGKGRTALFRAVVGVRIGTSTRLCHGDVRGSIARRPRGKGGFGFDPIFIPEGISMTFAQLTPEAKSRLSHRARAFETAANLLARSLPTQKEPE
ncbi:MAG: non-canonical purine NTP pyrophosphatase [Thermoplasmata archaeon]